MQPLSSLTLSHTSSITIRDRNLKISAVRTSVNTKHSSGISNRRRRTKLYTCVRDIISKSCRTFLHAFVMIRQSLSVVASRTFKNTSSIDVVLVTSSAIVSASRICEFVLKSEIERSNATVFAPHIERIGDLTIGTGRYTSLHGSTMNSAAIIVKKTKLSTIRCAFHEPRHCEFS